MHSGTSSVTAIAECTRHGRSVVRQPITIPDGADGCATVTGKEAPPAGDDIRPPVIRIPTLVKRGKLRHGEVFEVQLQFKHPSRTGLAYRDGKYLQETDPFYVEAMEVFYGESQVSRFEMTPALSDNPLITFKLRATAPGPLRIVLTNSRGQQFQTTEEIALS
jgi:hypothetical protein